MKKKCFRCGNTSKEAAIFSCELKGEEKFICATCLPMLIHGSY